MQPDAAIAAADFPISGEDKFLGNANLFTEPLFTQVFNQVTPENAGKWGSAAGLTPTAPMRWANLDAIYDFATTNGFPFNFHVLVWGNQQPTWMASLPPQEQLSEIDQWFAAVAARYSEIDWIQVVNEPLHDPPDCEHPMNQGASCPSSGDYAQALGGHNGTDGTGWDWVLNAFRLARQHFGPDAKLMLNDYSITSSSSATTQYLEIIELLQDEDLIDGIGVQGHAFSTTGNMAVHEANLDRLAATGLPIQVTELDIDGLPSGGLPGDEVQLADYRRILPTFWEHPAVEGITLWGWRQPSHWRNGQDAPIVLSTGELKPAAHWLFSYVNAIAPVIAPGQAFVLGDDSDAAGVVEAEDWASQIGRPDLRTFSWQITGGTGAEIFAIESSTGEVRVANPELVDRSASPYSLDVRVGDGFHTSDAAEVTISVPNAAPAIEAIAATPESGHHPLEVSFSVDASDPDGDDLSYGWDFGDGGTSSQQNPTHTYTQAGTYEVEVAVSDQEESVSDSVTIEVVEPPDLTPPVTTHDLVSDDPGAGGVYRAPVTVVFLAEDPGPDSSGVAHTEYRVNGGGWNVYVPSAPPIFDGDGDYTIEYRSIDGADNVEGARETTFSIELGTPRAGLAALPPLRRVGKRRRQVTYRARARNIGDAPWTTAEICVLVARSRLNIVGRRCRAIGEVADGRRHVEPFELRITPTARGRLTRIRFLVRGPGFDNQRDAARLIVRG